MKIFNWIFCIFCILCLPVYGFHISSILICMLGIISLPIAKIRNLWKALPKDKVLRPLIIGILFLLLCGFLPDLENESDQISSNVTTESLSTEVADIQESQIADSKPRDETEIVEDTQTEAQTKPSTEVTLSLANIPRYSGKPFTLVNDNVPEFRDTDLSTTSYEYYSDLDALGRCGVAYACVGTDLMPTEERGSIGSVKPTGWHTVKYDNVDGKYLYNRCHLIGYQLSGENANEKNLITGTRYLNVDGMLPFENLVADYVKETENHVMYRVTPLFDGDNLVASGVQIEAESVEDDGQGVYFNVYCYNVQPDIKINYATGDSKAQAVTSGDKAKKKNESSVKASDSTSDSGATKVWISATGHKYHSVNDCGNMNPDRATQVTEDEAINMGLGKCSRCW